MNKTLIIGLGIGAAALVYLWAKGSSVANMVSKLTITPKLHGKPSLKNGGGNLWDKFVSFATNTAYLEVPLDVDFQNRSDVEMNISVQSVMVYIKDQLVASNKPDNIGIKIGAFATSTLSGIKMQMKTNTLISVLGNIVEKLLTSGDFSAITKDMVIKIGATLNNTFVFDVAIKLGETSTVDTSKSNVSISGLGLVAASKRNIKSIDDYIAYIPSKSLLHYNDYIVKANGNVIDTAKIMHMAATADKGNVADLAHHLEKDNLKDTLQSIFDFVYTHIQYELDSRFTEQVRRPLRCLYDQKGDCDCYATLIGSMLEALHIPYKFRIAAYEAGRYQHVYVIVPTIGGHYTVDPVLDRCFQEKPTTKYIDI